MERLNLKPTHKAVQNYYEALSQFKTIDVSHEGAVRSAFQTMLEHCGRQFGWKLVPEWAIKKDARSIRVDGALVDEYRLTHGFWEAKDTADDLAKEVKKKLTAGYPASNIIFQAPERAILLQNGRVVLDEDITEPRSWKFLSGSLNTSRLNLKSGPTRSSIFGIECRSWVKR